MAIDTTLKEDSTPWVGLRSAGAASSRGTHVHFWSDVTILESEYTEETCCGEKWSPLSKEHVFPRGCGARRRILKTIYAHHSQPRPSGACCPPDSAWEPVDPSALQGHS